VLSTTSGALALALLLTHASGRSTLPLRSFVTPLLGASLLLFAAVFLGRLVRARGERRRTLASLFGAMAVPYSLAGACLFLQRWGVAKAHLDILSTPLLALAPVANVAAFVRHDLWESRALLSRVLARSATVLAAGVVAVGVGTAVTYSSGGSFAHTFGAVAVGAALASALALPSLAMLDRALFGARAEYKPTVEQLSEELASIASRDEVARAVERTVQRWLPCDDVRLVTMRTEWSEPSGIRPASSGPAPELELAGYRSIDVCFRGTCLARLTVGPKRGGALFTSEDMDLLRTIANQGALALAHASAYAQLDDRRRQQMSAWRGERTAIVETVAAEIAHEIRYPLNFFRAMIARASRTGGLRPADIEVGSEEVRRLEKLVTGLRTKTGPNAAREAVRLADVCARAEVLLRDVLDGRSLEVAVGDAALTCDADQLTQVLVNLVSNSLEATGPSGRVGVMWRAGRSGDALLCVWDDGPGFDDDPAQIFAPWYTTKPRGTGLGLAITHRIVRAHGWSIDARRERDRTVLSISVPDRDIVREVGEVA
jgi:nitrogen-specific signal transduction histidine kinase